MDSPGAATHAPTHSTEVTSFDKRLSSLCGSIDELEQRVATAEAHAACAAAKAQHYAARLANSEAQLEIVLTDFANSLETQEALTHEVEGLRAQLDSCQLGAESEVLLLQHTLEHESVEKARLRSSLASAQLDRDDAIADLASAYADMQAMQAALLDSALYVRFLRARLVEAQISGHRMSSADGGSSENCSPNGGEAAAIFSFEKTKEAIQKAVRDAAALDGPERAKRIKQLRLRWHPDKNPVLQEFATEVTKIINKAVEALDLES